LSDTLLRVDVAGGKRRCVIAVTGSYDTAFVIAGALLVHGAASILTLTCQHIGGRVVLTAPARA